MRRKIRDIWNVLMTGDPLLTMVVVFCGTFAVLMLAAIIFALIYTA